MRLVTLKPYLLWTVLLLLPSALPAAVISLAGPAGPVAQGATVTVNVNIATAPGENIWAYQFDIFFDPAFLQFDTAFDGTFLPPADLALATLIWNPYTPGDSAVTGIGNSLSGSAPGVSGAGLLAQVRFLALAASPAAFLTPLNTILLDSDLDQLAGVTQTGTFVQIKAEAGVPEPATYWLAAIALAAFASLRFNASSNRSRS